MAPLRTPNLILGSSPPLFAALGAKMLARRLGVPFILEIRDLWPETLVDARGMSPRHPVVLGLRWIERHLYKHANAIISLLEGAEEYIESRGGAGGPVHWVPNGVDLDYVVTPEPAVRDGPFRVIYSGAHGMMNGLDTVLRAAEILQERCVPERVHLWLVGDGPEKPRLQERAKALELNNVVFHDAVPKAQLGGLLRNADACLVHLRDSPVFQWGVSPNKLYDYCAAARPIIFAVNTRFNPLREIDAGPSIPGESPDALASAILDLARASPSHRQRLGSNAWRFVQTTANVESLTGKLEEALIQAARVP